MLYRCKSRVVSLAVFMVILWIGLAPDGLGQSAFYVAPDGDDAKTGSIDKPLATLGEARDRVRALNAAMDDDITVYLRGGVYRLTEPLVFTGQDSGRNGRRVVYRNYPGEEPILSGGRVIGGWTLHEAGKNIWSASATGLATRQLYVDGVRATRARSLGGLGEVTRTETGFVSPGHAMGAWRNVSDIEFVFRKEWTEPRCPVASIDGDMITMQQPAFEMCQNKAGVSIDNPAWIENAYELLDEAGEWYLDRPAGVLFYIPRQGETLADAEVIAPVLETLIAGEGTLEEPVENLWVEGLTFSHATWLRPGTDEGFAEIQANYCRHPEATEANNWQMDTWVKTPGAVTFRAAKNVVFERNRFCKLGAAGLNFEYGSQGNAVRGNEFFDISGCGVQLGDTFNHHPDDPRDVIKDNLIANNAIHQIGVEYHAGVAIFVLYAENTRILHNELWNLPYTGVSIGWGWGGTDVPGDPTTSRNNRIAFNRIHDLMLELRDGGGIYSLASQPGEVIEGNLIYNQPNVFGSIYLDNGSQYVKVKNNIVHDTLLTYLVKGSDHVVQYNFWPNEQGLDNGIPARYPLPGGGSEYLTGDSFLWKFSDNTQLADLAAMPASIINAAGLEAEYRDLAPRPTPSDAQPPTAPQGLAATGHTDVTISLAWDAAEDNVGVTGYEIHCNGERVGATAGTRWCVTGIAPARQYRFEVLARDAAGNLSAPSATLIEATAGFSGNLALRKPAYGFYLNGRQSNFHFTHDAWTAVDGDPASYAQAFGQWRWNFLVDLVAPTTIERVVIHFPEPLRATDFDVLYSLDRENWETLAEVRDFQAQRYELDFDAIPTRYIRIDALKPDGPDQEGGQMAIAELEIYGPASASESKVVASGWARFE